MIKKIQLLIILFFFIQTSYTQNLEFFREDITFTIKDNYFFVEGVYYFRNNFNENINRPLYYPFPTEDIYGEITDCVISKENVLVEILKQSRKACFFKIEIKPNEEAIYTIKYKQELFSDKAKYILTSTQKWGQPLELINYQLIPDKDFEISNFSYQPDRKIIKNDKIYYYWHKVNFMPDKDFIITFIP